MEGTGNIPDLIRNNQNKELEELLAADPSGLEIRMESGISHLQFAIYCRNSGAAEILRRYYKEISFFEAVSLGEEEIVDKFLMESNFNINSFSPDGFTALGLAVFFKNRKLVQLLLDKGANVNLSSSNSFKVAPIHSACAVQDLEIVEMLLEKGANVNARQMQGITPLHSAAHNGNLALVKLLLLYNAEPGVVNENGKTPAEMAEEMGYTEVEHYLREQTAP